MSCFYLCPADTVPPVVTCPEDIVVTILTGSASGAPVEWIEPVAVDNSGTANLISQTQQSGAFFGIGQTSVTYRYADNSGNVGSCTFTVTVEDGKRWLDIFFLKIEKVDIL